MFAIIDSRSSKRVISTLKGYVEGVFAFQTNGLTYDSISGHPDIFLYQDNDHLVVAPNAPVGLFEFLERHSIAYLKGKMDVGNDPGNSVQYNCLGTPDFLFHKHGYTDPIILEINREKEFIQLPQAYTRCSLVHLYGNNYVTSDRGIEKVLLGKGFSCFYFNPEEICIRNHKNGFIGGAAGVLGKSIFFNGSIEMHEDGQRLKEHLLNLGLEIVCLSDEYLYDSGCIFFV